MFCQACARACTRASTASQRASERASEPASQRASLPWLRPGRFRAARLPSVHRQHVRLGCREREGVLLGVELAPRAVLLVLDLEGAAMPAVPVAAEALQRVRHVRGQATGLLDGLLVLAMTVAATADDGVPTDLPDLPRVLVCPTLVAHGDGADDASCGQCRGRRRGNGMGQDVW